MGGVGEAVAVRAHTLLCTPSCRCQARFKVNLSILSDCLHLYGMTSVAQTTLSMGFAFDDRGCMLS